MAHLDSVGVTQAERHKETGDASNQGEQIVLLANASHSLKELSPVKDSDSVQEHDQPGQADGSGDLCFRSKCAKGQPHEQDSADAKRKAADIDLANQVT